ncbi:ABC transporter substrate-binding protein [Rhizobium azibense]|nr:ABC transporter substrate-binding protein [Rhizobium azibense]
MLRHTRSPWPAEVWLAALLISFVAAAPGGMAAHPIRLGVVQSSTGAFAAEETGLTEMLRMLVAEQNGKGALLGRRVELVIIDRASVTSDYEAGARTLISRSGVSALFGGALQATCDAMGKVAQEGKIVLFCPCHLVCHTARRPAPIGPAGPGCKDGSGRARRIHRL